MAYDPATQLPVYTPSVPSHTLLVDGHEDLLHQTDRQELRGLKNDWGLSATAGSLQGYRRAGNAAGQGIWIPAEAAVLDPIQNGTFNVWPVGTTFTSIANGTYSAEGWVYALSGSSVVHDLLRSTDVPAVAALHPLVNYSLHLDVTTADAAVAAGDLCAIQTRMEGYNWEPYAQRAFSFGFWVKDTKTGIHCVSLRNSTSDRSYVAEYTISVADTWEYKIIQVAASPSAGTWDYTTGIGLAIGFPVIAGSTFQTTAGAWQTGNFWCTSNMVNSCDNTANNFKVAMVGPLTLGTVALPHRPRPIQLDEQIGERYFCKTFPAGTAPAQNTGSALGALTYRAAVAAANANGVWWQFPRRMRAAPTVTLYNPSAANSNWRNATGAADSGASSTANIGENGAFISNAQAAADAVGNLLNIHAQAAARL